MEVSGRTRVHVHRPDELLFDRANMVYKCRRSDGGLRACAVSGEGPPHTLWNTENFLARGDTACCNQPCPHACAVEVDVRLGAQAVGLKPLCKAIAAPAQRRGLLHKLHRSTRLTVLLLDARAGYIPLVSLNKAPRAH